MRTKYRIIKTEEELNKLIKCCKETGYACIDFETNAEPIYNKTFKPTILSVTFQPGFGCSIPLQHHEAKNKKFCGNDWNWKKMFSKFGHEVIENPDIVKCSWNGKFDFQIFELYGIYLRGTMIDGMLAKYVLNEERPNGLKDMVKRYLPEAAGYEADKGFDKLPWDKKPLEDLCKYGCQDTDYTFRLCIFFESRLIELGLYDLYRNLIMPASRVLQTCEANGLYMDRKFNKELLETYKPKIDKARETCMNLPKVKRFQKWYSQQKINKYIKSIQDELDELDPNDPKDKRKIASREQKISNIEAGIFTTKKEQELIRPVNLGSPVDLPILMFSEEGFNMPIIKYTVDKKTGKESNKPSTDEETLTELRLKFKNPKSPKAIFLDSLLELRGLEKMYKTYILGWSEKVQDDDCLHGRYLIHGTDSGRLSSQEPNMQQIPKTSVDPNIKKQLVAKPGTLYLVCDFSQAELRIMAHLSGDETYLNAFNSGQDPHLAIAAKKYGIPYEEAYKIYDDENHPDHGIWKVRRKQAKQIAFGLIYGIGAKLLAVKLSDPKSGLIVTPEEAQKEMDIFFKQHPKLKTFKAKQEKFLKKYGYLKSLFGRKRRLPQIYSDNKQEQAYAIRLALNFPCQSAASDMTLFGSILIYYMMRQGKLPMMQEVATVHDATYNNTDPNYINIWTVYTMWKIFSNPSTKNFFGFQISDVTMDMDYTIGRTMAEELPFIPGYDYNKMLQPDFSVEEYMEEHKKYKGISIADFPKLYKKEMKAYEESWIKYKDFKHVKKCGIL
jgi:DNA polymerase-1